MVKRVKAYIGYYEQSLKFEKQWLKEHKNAPPYKDDIIKSQIEIRLIKRFIKQLKVII